VDILDTAQSLPIDEARSDEQVVFEENAPLSETKISFERSYEHA